MQIDLSARLSLVRVLDIGNDTVTDMAFDPNGATLAVALYENGVQLWRLTDGVLLHRLHKEAEDYAAHKSIALSPDGQFLFFSQKGEFPFRNAPDVLFPWMSCGACTLISLRCSGTSQLELQYGSI